MSKKKKKKESLALYSIEDGKLFVLRDDKERELVCENCQNILVGDLVDMLSSKVVVPEDEQMTQITKTTSCDFAFRQSRAPYVKVIVVAHESGEFFASSTIRCVEESIETYGRNEERSPVLSYYNRETSKVFYPTLEFSYRPDGWIAKRVNNASFAEINFLYSILVKYGFIK